MEPIPFKEQTTVYAKNQPEYNPLPSHKRPNDPQGAAIFCWRLTWRERLRLLVTGKLWHSVLTLNTPLQPQLLSVDKPDMPATNGQEITDLP